MDAQNIHLGMLGDKTFLARWDEHLRQVIQISCKESYSKMKIQVRHWASKVGLLQAFLLPLWHQWWASRYCWAYENLGEQKTIVVHHHLIVQDSTLCKKWTSNSRQLKLKRETGSYDQMKRQQSFSSSWAGMKTVFICLSPLPSLHVDLLGDNPSISAYLLSKGH